MVINKQYITTTIVFFLSIFVIDFLGSKLSFLHYGKDGGLVFRILSSGVINALFFYMITKKFTLMLLGFVCWFILVVLHIFVLIPNQITWQNLILDHFSLFTIMFLIVFLIGYRTN